MMKPLLFTLLLCPIAAFGIEPPAVPHSQQEIRRLIAALADNNYFVRQKAEKELAKIGFDAVDALSAATDSDDFEVAVRADRLLRSIKGNWARPGDPAAVVQYLSEYESQDDSGRASRLEYLIGLPDHQGLPAVCRAICYDRSPLVAKQAVLALIKALGSEEVKPGLAADVRKRLATSRRPAAEWVRNWLDVKGDPAALAALWTRLDAAEQELSRRRPQETSPAIVETLLQLQIAALRRAHRGAEATAGLERLMGLHPWDQGTLIQLMNWLIEQKDWPATRRVEEHFRTTIGSSDVLLYLVAEAQAQRGDADRAEGSAAELSKLRGDPDERSLRAHLQSAETLEGRGRYEWAIRELSYVARTARPASQTGFLAAHSLAELYHELGRDREAAETLQRVEACYASRSNQWRLGDDDEGPTVGELRARRLYFDACAWREQRDTVKQRAALEAALATGSYDVEVLIECYRLEDAPAGYRENVLMLIDKKLCRLREEAADEDRRADERGTSSVVARNSAAAQPRNNFAWLVANTEGDLDEAQRCAKRAIELVGENGAFRDTLARVYYARGDLNEALKQQTAAAALLPHAPSVQKQLEMIKSMVAKKP